MQIYQRKMSVLWGNVFNEIKGSAYEIKLNSTFWKNTK